MVIFAGNISFFIVLLLEVPRKGLKSAINSRPAIRLGEGEESL